MDRWANYRTNIGLNEEVEGWVATLAACGSLAIIFNKVSRAAVAPAVARVWRNGRIRIPPPATAQSHPNCVGRKRGRVLAGGRPLISPTAKARHAAGGSFSIIFSGVKGQGLPRPSILPLPAHTPNA